MKEKAKVFVIDAVDIIWDWLFAHDLLVSIVSSIISRYGETQTLKLGILPK